MSDAIFYVHGLPARSFECVASYLTGDAHDRSKVQVYLPDSGEFLDVALAPDKVKETPVDYMDIYRAGQIYRAEQDFG